MALTAFVGLVVLYQQSSQAERLLSFPAMDRPNFLATNHHKWLVTSLHISQVLALPH